MRPFRSIAVVVGLLALSKFQSETTYGTFVLAVTAFYAALALGLWKKAAWVVLPGMVATLAQTAPLST